ncbi:MAG: plastocyanin/azurin family copper-binding protein [Chloroflexota bacterium]
MSFTSARRGMRAAMGLSAAFAAVLLAGSVAGAQSPAASMAPMGTMGPAPSMAPAGPGPNDAGFVAGTEAAPRHIPIAVNDQLLFAPNVIDIAEGETITFDVTNVGKAEHEFKVGLLADVIADAEAAPEISSIPAGSTASITYTFTGAGPFGFACHEPGHFEHGMMGYLITHGPDVPTVGTAEAPRQVVVTASDQMRFTPETLDVKQGETIQFIVVNNGSAKHEFQVGDADMVANDKVDGAKVVEIDGIDPAHVASITYTFDGTGPYAFACHEPGHYEAGMKGSVNVTP